MFIKIKFHGKVLKLLLERHSDFSVFYDVFVEQEYPNLATEIKEGYTIIDAGGNIGMFTVAASILVGNRGHVVSIEPSPENLKILMKNIELNNLKNITVIDRALYGKSDERVRFHQEGGLSRIVTDETKAFNDAIDVATITLDDILSEYGIVPNILKMDIEGGEKFALLSAKNTMNEIDSFWAEIHDSQSYDALMRFSNQFSIKKEKIESNRNALSFAIKHPLKILKLEYYNRFSAFKNAVSSMTSTYNSVGPGGIYSGHRLPH